jgi:Bacteriophage probable baseplate hub protein
MAGFSTYAPEFSVQINDAEIPAALRSCITSVRYEDGIPSMLTEADKDGSKAADRVEIEFANPNLRWLQSHIRGLGFRPFPTGVKLGPVRLPDAQVGNAFDLDNTLSLQVGYAPGERERLFFGEVTGVQADFPATGVPTVTLVAHDFMQRLTQGKIARGFSILPDFVIAAIMSAENLLLPIIDPVVIAESTATAVLNAVFKGSGRKQRGQNDLDLMKEIAELYDADFWVGDPPFEAEGLRGRTLYLSRIVFKEYEPRMTLTWGESLVSFTPRVSKVGQVAGVAIKFTVPLIPITFITVVAWDFDRESLSVSILPGCGLKVATIAGGVMEVVERTANNPADIMHAALVITRLLRKKINNRLTGSGTAVGDPRIRAGAVVRLDGLGPSFSGVYRVTSAIHTIDSGGYRTDFKVRRELIP